MAASIKIDDASALLVIDVRNCFLPVGSLAVKDGDQDVPVDMAKAGVKRIQSSDIAV